MQQGQFVSGTTVARALERLDSGVPASKVAAEFNVSVPTIYNWKRRRAERGVTTQAVRGRKVGTPNPAASKAAREARAQARTRESEVSDETTAALADLSALAEALK